MTGYLEFLPPRMTSARILSGFLALLVCSIVLRYSLSTGLAAESRVYYSSSLKDLISRSSNDGLHDKVQGPTSCVIIIRSYDGALGNRMFLFASAYGLARLHQCSLYVAPYILTDLRSVFVVNISQTRVHITTNDSEVINRTDVYGRYSACTLYSDLFRIPLNKNMTRYEMVGFYQAYGYFEKYRDEINYLFQFNAGSIEGNVAVVESLLRAVWNVSLNLGNYTKENVPHPYLKSLLITPPPNMPPVTWVGIHIRRGDFLTFFKIDTSVEYLTWAMNYFRKKYVNCRFLIASDDKKFVETYFGNLTDVFITPKKFFSGHDMAALALCEHTIVSAGTYGWWAGWLAGGDVVHDLNYPVPFQNCVKEHYFPPWFLFPHSSVSKGSNATWSV